MGDDTSNDHRSRDGDVDRLNLCHNNCAPQCLPSPVVNGFSKLLIFPNLEFLTFAND
jgi:hypothetical protein